MKSTIITKIGFLFFVAVCGAVITIAFSYSFYSETVYTVPIVNAAGQQRMLSQSIINSAQQVYLMEQDDYREHLRKAVAEFDHNLETLELGGILYEEVVGYNPSITYNLILPSAPPEVITEINVVKKLWTKLKDPLIQIADKSVSDPKSQEAFALITSNIDQLPAASDRVVMAFQMRDLALKEQTFIMITATAFFDIFLFIAGIWMVMGYVSDRKRIEAELQENERKFSTLYESSSDAVMLLDQKGFFDCNKATLKMFGYSSKEEFCSKHPSELSPPIQPNGNNSMTLASKHIEKALKWGNHSFEWCHEKSDGTQFPCEVLLNAMEVIDKKILQAVVRDITVRKQNENMLLQREKEQRDILNAIQVGIVLIDPETRKIVKCNPAVLKMLNASVDQIIGTISPSFMNPKLKHHSNSLDKHQKIDQMEEELITVKGVKIPILKTVTKIELNGKELLLETFIDISDLKKVELQRQILEIEMIQARKLEAVGSLAAGIAHEINTPIQFVGDNTNFLSDSFKSLLSLIKTYDDLWQKASDTGINIRELDSERYSAVEKTDLEYIKKEVPSAIEQTLEGVRRVTKIVGAMKNFAHSDHGTKSISNLNDMLESTLTVARNELKYVADVEINFDKGLPDIECYRDDLNQVFLNLLVNAAHTIADVIGDASETKGIISVSTVQEDQEVVIRIADTGKGIPRSIQDRVFDPFFSTKEVGKGSGQGLAIARKIIVEKHNGRIDFDTEEGKGTTFIIRLPINTHADYVEVI